MNQIIYLMSGPAHLPYLITSLAALRQTWGGVVRVYTWPESFWIRDHIAADDRLGTTLVSERVPEYRGKNAQFIDKISLLQSQTMPSLYLDADTLPVGDVRPLLDQLETHSFVATQFGDWTTSGKTIRARIERLKAFPEIPQLLVRRASTRPAPSPNGGVVAARPDSPILPVWHSWTREARSTFIADETVLQIIQMDDELRQHMTTARGGEWNCSPKHQPRGLRDDEVRIWHGHGDCWTRPEKSAKGAALWWASWQRCLEQDVAHCSSWWRRCGNGRLEKLSEEMSK